MMVCVNIQWGVPISNGVSAVVATVANGALPVHCLHIPASRILAVSSLSTPKTIAR